MRKLPKFIDGIAVMPSGESVTIAAGQRWQGMRPIDDTIERYWEYSVTTGRILDMTKEVFGND